jgi:hypothetical protein
MTTHDENPQVIGEADNPPPEEPSADANPAYNEQPKDAYTGRPDQGVTANTGPGAGGATQWGGGNKNHPSRRNSNVRQGGG